MKPVVGDYFSETETFTKKVLHYMDMISIFAIFNYFAVHSQVFTLNYDV